MKRRGALFFLILTAASALFANDPVRPKNEGDLTQGTYARDPVLHVPKAVPIGFSREQFLRDFPELAPFIRNQDEFDAFLVANVSYVGTEQKRLDGIRNTVIPTDDQKSEAITRNARAGNLEAGDRRAGFLEIRHPQTKEVVGLIGIKGMGFKTSLGTELVEQQREQAKKVKTQYEETVKRIKSDPTLDRPQKLAELEKAKAAFEQERDAIFTRDHSSGLVTVGEAFHELAKQRTLQARLEAHNARNGTNFQTNEVYGIIALPFYVLNAGGKRERAALIVRQSEFRGPQFAAKRQGIPEDLFTDWYGFSQSTASNALIDFGGGISNDPLLSRAYGIEDPVQREAKNAQYSSAWAIGHRIPEWVEGELSAGRQDRWGADKLLREHLEKTLAWMMEPVEADRQKALAGPQPARHALPHEDFSSLWAELEAARRGAKPLTRALLDRAAAFMALDPTEYVKNLSAHRKQVEGPEANADVITHRRGEYDVRNNDAALIRQQKNLLLSNLGNHFDSLEGAEYLTAKDTHEGLALAFSLMPKKKFESERGQALLRRMLIQSVTGPEWLRRRLAEGIIPALSAESWAHPDLRGIIGNLFSNLDPGETGHETRRLLADLLFNHMDKIPEERLIELSALLARAAKEKNELAFHYFSVLANKAARHLGMSLSRRAAWMAEVDYRDAKHMPVKNEMIGQWRKVFLRTFYPSSQENIEHTLNSVLYGDLTPRHLGKAVELVEYLEKHELRMRERLKFYQSLKQLYEEGMLPEELQAEVKTFLDSRRPQTSGGVVQTVRDWCLGSGAKLAQ